MCVCVLEWVWQKSMVNLHVYLVHFTCVFRWFDECSAFDKIWEINCSKITVYIELNVLIRKLVTNQFIDDVDCQLCIEIYFIDNSKRWNYIWIFEWNEILSCSRFNVAVFLIRFMIRRKFNKHYFNPAHLRK